MIYVFGVLGFIGGFALGIMVLSFLLRGVDSETLVNDKHIKFKYGLLTWLIAGLSSYSAVYCYKLYFM